MAFDGRKDRACFVEATVGDVLAGKLDAGENRAQRRFQVVGRKAKIIFQIGIDP